MLQPHRSRYWLNSKEKDTPEFKSRVREVCDTYKKAPERLKNEGIHTIGVDEKTGMQAWERAADPLPMKPGILESREHEYTRHGTQCLTANFEVATGEIIAPTIEETRTEPEFASHIERTIATDPEAGWIFVADNLTTHVSETLVLLIAGMWCIPVETLGKKEKYGVLKSVESRREFLADLDHRIRFVYVPKHTSWLNQVEIWFSVLSRRLLKRGNFLSKDDLRKQVLNFIAYQNRVHAKPYKWTYTGRPLAA